MTPPARTLSFAEGEVTVKLKLPPDLADQHTDIEAWLVTELKRKLVPAVKAAAKDAVKVGLTTVSLTKRYDTSSGNIKFTVTVTVNRLMPETRLLMQIDDSLSHSHHILVLAFFGDTPPASATPRLSDILRNLREDPTDLDSLQQLGEHVIARYFKDQLASQAPQGDIWSQVSDVFAQPGLDINVDFGPIWDALTKRRPPR